MTTSRFIVVVTTFLCQSYYYHQLVVVQAAPFHHLHHRPLKKPFAVKTTANTKKHVSSSLLRSKEFQNRVSDHHPSLWNLRGGGSTGTTAGGGGTTERSKSKQHHRRIKPKHNPDTTTTTTTTTTTASTTWNENNEPPLTYNQTSTKIGSTPLSTLLHSLQTNPTTGLSDEEASHRRTNLYGENKLKAPPTKSLFQLTLEQFDDKLVQILLAVALLSGIFSYLEMKAHALETGQTQSILKSFVEPIVILAILVVNAVVGVWQGKSAEGSLEALKKLQPSLATVLRNNGQWKDNIDSSELVPGDIIQFRVGDKISADARIVSMESSTLSMDEGSLTGESVTVEKLPGDEGLCEDDDAPVQDMKSVVFSGTVCTSGSAIAVVTRTGMETEIGKIQKVSFVVVFVVRLYWRYAYRVFVSKKCSYVRC